MFIPLPYFFYLLSEKQFPGHEISIIGSEIQTTGAHTLSYHDTAKKGVKESLIWTVVLEVV